MKDNVENMADILELGRNSFFLRVAFFLKMRMLKEKNTPGTHKPIASLIAHKPIHYLTYFLLLRRKYFQLCKV